jgi:hypothetical protein
MNYKALKTYKPLKEVYGFYYEYDPEFTWWVEKPYETLSKK